MPHIEWQILVSQVGTFLVALFIIWKFAWKQLVKMINDRNDSIKKNMEYSEQTRQAAAKLEEEYQLKLQQIKEKSTELINLAKAEANKVRENIIKKSQDEAQDIITRTKEQLEYERQRLIQELRPYVVDYAMRIAEKTLKEFAKDALQKKRFEEILTALESSEVREKLV